MTSSSKTDRSASTDEPGQAIVRSRWLRAVAPVVFVLAMVGLPARATYGNQTTADEPQYLLTAISLIDDFDLDISDELRDESYRPFHETRPDQQTFDLDESGRQVSPHDPLLPILLMVPMALGGWVGAKVALAALAAATAALTAALAHRRGQVSAATSAIVTIAGFGGLPLAGYGTQVYPEMPAALAVVLMVAGLTSPSVDRRSVFVVLAALIALPWLAVKYVPVAAVGGVALLWRLRHRQGWLVGTTMGAAIAAVIYLVAHQWIYGGWTVYAAGDHFATTGEFTVVGTNVDVVGRSRRLIGLLVDRHFGLAAWSPLWFVLPLAVVGAVGARRAGGRDPVSSRDQVAVLSLWLLAVTWLNATFVALTMHGWWVPGRQLVVALPLAVILVAQWADGTRRRVQIVVALGLCGLYNWLWLAIEASTGRRTLVVDFAETASWPYRTLAVVLPDGLVGGVTNDASLVAWAVMIAIVAGAASRRHQPTSEP